MTISWNPKQTDPVTDRRLVSISAEKVLGEYDHQVTFAPPGDFVIVYGPNGIGKTRLLEAVEALSTLNTVRLHAIPFQSISLHYDDGHVLSAQAVDKVYPPRRARHHDSDEPETMLESRREVLVTLTVKGQHVADWTSNLATDFPMWLAHETTWEPTPDQRRWRDRTDGELVQFAQLRRMYLPRFHRDQNREVQEVPGDLTLFTRSLNVHLIETQRLQVSDQAHGGVVRDSDADPSVPTVVEYSRFVRKQLNDNLSSNSRLTQRLDSTFPRRMLERGDKTVLTEREVRDKWRIQRKRRARLEAIAELGVDPELSLPETELNPWQISMLELYLADADEKLDSFEFVLKRIDLLEDIVNARLLRKSLTVNAVNGLVVTRHVDGTQIDLASLSSGEQHEIILMFDLLFNVNAGSLVLIDEPEISLHIGWQLAFVADVRRIASMVGFQFLVATHSPQIIDRWWNRASQLGPDIDFHGNGSSNVSYEG